ncbi:MAG: hypothetical protein ACLQU4_00310 [Limisphaerales bacterium]
MEHFLNHLIQRHVMPLLLIPVVMSSFSCFAILQLPEVFRSSSTPDQVVAVVFSLIGIFGTFGTYKFFRVIRHKAPTWRVFELGRTAWLVLIGMAWFAGLGCGVLMLYETSR